MIKCIESVFIFKMPWYQVKKNAKIISTFFLNIFLKVVYYIYVVITVQFMLFLGKMQKFYEFSLN